DLRGHVLDLDPQRSQVLLDLRLETLPQQLLQDVVGLEDRDRPGQRFSDRVRYLEQIFQALGEGCRWGRRERTAHLLVRRRVVRRRAWTYPAARGDHAPDQRPRHEWTTAA